MEADLGIDSIKKIEIFSELREHHAVLRVEDEERTLEELSGLRTLGSIIDWYRHNLEKKNHLTSQQQVRTSTCTTPSSAMWSMLRPWPSGSSYCRRPSMGFCCWQDPALP
jgi:hypothetical protein